MTSRIDLEALAGRVSTAIKRFFGGCEHDWRDDYEFIASAVLTYSMDHASMRPVTIQTMQHCEICGETRRKPGSARPAESDPS